MVIVSDVEFDGTIFRAKENLIPAAKELNQNFEKNSGHTNILCGHMHYTSRHSYRMLHRITDTFGLANQASMREVSLLFNINAAAPCWASCALPPVEVIDNILTYTCDFGGLTDFSFVQGQHPIASESALATVVMSLPHLHTIVITSGRAVVKLKEYIANLGDALALCTNLRSLHIRNLQTFNNSWLNWDWLPRLVELTIEVDPTAPKFEERNLLIFVWFFRETLVSLYIENGNTRFPRRRRERHQYSRLASEFTKLRYLTYSGDPSALWTFSRAPYLRILTWSIVNQPLRNLDVFAADPPSDVRECWPALMEVQVSDEIDGNGTNGHPDITATAEYFRFCECLRLAGIALQPIKFESFGSYDLNFIHLHSTFFPRPSSLPMNPESLLVMSD